MAKFKYTAKDTQGKNIKGVTDAVDEEELYTKLRQQGYYVLNCKNTEERKFGKGPKMKTPVLAEFCRELGTMLNSGVSLVRALSIMAAEEGIKPETQKVYIGILTIIRQGTPLSDAMEGQGRAFPTLLINMIRSAEANGNIGDTCLQMSVNYEKEHKLNGKVKSSMMYPCVLAVLLVLVIIFILTYLVPQFKDVFDGMGGALPLPTKILMGLSNGMKAHWPVITAVIVVGVVVIRTILQIPAIKLQKDKLKLRLPIMGKLWKTIYTARFARTLSSLYSSGLPIVSALQISSRIIGNTYIQSQFPDVIAQVRAGNALSKSLSQIDGFQKKLSSTIAIGEESGQLEHMLTSIADSMEYDSEKALERMVGIIEPVMIIIMAVIIGSVVVAVILPIYQSYSSIEQGGY